MAILEIWLVRKSLPAGQGLSTPSMITASPSGLTGETANCRLMDRATAWGEAAASRSHHTQQSGQEQIMGKSGEEQITRELIYRAVTSPPRIPSANSAGRDKRIVFIDPSFTLQCWVWEGARAMYDVPKRI